MKSSSGQAMVPASICPFPHNMFFNGSVCRCQDRPNGVPHLVAGSVAVAEALGCGKALGVGATTHVLIVECSAGSKPTPTGARPPDGASPKALLLPLSILRFPLAAKCRVWARLHHSLYFLCWPEVWSSWFTHRPRGAESTSYNTLSQLVFSRICSHYLLYNELEILALPTWPHACPFTITERYSNCGPIPPTRLQCSKI